MAFTLYELVRWFSVNVKAFESRVIAFESCVIDFESRVIAYVTQVFKQCVGILGRVCFFFRCLMQAISEPGQLILGNYLAVQIKKIAKKLLSNFSRRFELLGNA